MSRLVVGLCALPLALRILAGGVAAGFLGGGADCGGSCRQHRRPAAQEIPTDYQWL
ncbi:hypothetical protein [Parafrankia sp. BMG5.11]|uniref:hypothetical protein n=1 Tax=Parafrankia sp. BMG5.11 TaxID=222540 RepID=UPI001404DFF8|nr:hypothetical protein [Parafrankia sp. BMG5.11]